MARPTAALELLLLLCCSAVLAAACSVTSSSALSVTLPPALTVLPETVRSLALPPPVARMSTLPPAATVLPTAVVLLCAPLLWLLLLPTVMVMPTLLGSAVIASIAFFAASPVVSPASACSRPSLVWPAASVICWAV